MWGKKEMNIHDKEIVGFLYKKNDQLLVLLSSDENNIFLKLQYEIKQYPNLQFY